MLPKIKVVGLTEQEGAVGIHLIEPTLQEIDLAVETAEAKGFREVFVHRNFEGCI